MEIQSDWSAIIMEVRRQCTKAPLDSGAQFSMEILGCSQTRIENEQPMSLFYQTWIPTSLKNVDILLLVRVLPPIQV